MRPSCETCSRPLQEDSAAYICSYECTFCPDCAQERHRLVCPNCGGELVARPKRVRAGA